VEILEKNLSVILFAKRVLLIGALLGLVFSNAEGVSLLPFPEAPHGLFTTENHEVEAGENGYNQSVKPGRSLQTKAAKTKSSDPVRDNNATAISVEPAFVLVRSIELTGSGIPHIFSASKGSQITRGPPAV
jgi:hypothetical protein